MATHRPRTAFLRGLLMALALVAPLGCSTAAATSGCVTGIPVAAYTVADYARSHNGAAQPGYVGNTVFQNREGHLDDTLGPFREYDVNPKRSGQGRDAERVVLGPTKAASFYTADHYATFATMCANAPVRG